MPHELEGWEWSDIRQLVAVDEILSPAENEQFCPRCKDKARTIERECIGCGTIYNYSDKSSPDGVIVREVEGRQKKSNFWDGMMTQMVKKILIEGHVLK